MVKQDSKSPSSQSGVKGQQAEQYADKEEDLNLIKNNSNTSIKSTPNKINNINKSPAKSEVKSE